MVGGGGGGRSSSTCRSTSLVHTPNCSSRGSSAAHEHSRITADTHSTRKQQQLSSNDESSIDIHRIVANESSRHHNEPLHCAPTSNVDTNAQFPMKSRRKSPATKLRAYDARLPTAAAAAETKNSSSRKKTVCRVTADTSNGSECVGRCVQLATRRRFESWQ